MLQNSSGGVDRRWPGSPEDGRGRDDSKGVGGHWQVFGSVDGVRGALDGIGRGLQGSAGVGRACF